MKLTYKLCVFLFAFFFLSNTVVAYHFISEKVRAGKFADAPSKVLEKKENAPFLVLNSLKVKSPVSYGQLQNRSIELLRVFHFSRSLSLDAERSESVFVLNFFLLTSFTKAP